MVGCVNVCSCCSKLVMIRTVWMVRWVMTVPQCTLPFPPHLCEQDALGL